MKYGLYIPPFGEYADARVVAELAYEAEEAGWDGLFIWDHIVMGWTDQVIDPWIALTAAAMETRQLRLGPMVTPLPRRRPWKVARETASLDQLSDGRLTLGVGLGYGEHEFATFNEPASARTRAAMLDESLEVLTSLWSGEEVDYDGVHYQIERTRFLPRPRQKPRIPIWVAGLWPNKAPFRRAARWDGVFPLPVNVERNLTPEEIREIVAYIRQHRESDAPFDVAHSGATWGDADHRRAQVEPYAEAGVTWWLENINPWRFDWAEEGPWPVAAMRQQILEGPPA